MKNGLIWAHVAAFLSLQLCGCFQKSKVIENTSFHKHWLYNGVATLTIKDSIFIDKYSRRRFGVLRLNTPHFYAIFNEPLDATDSVSVLVDRNEKIVPYSRKCVIDSSKSTLEKIPFSVADSIIENHIPMQSSVTEKFAFYYRIRCDGDVEEGEIHMVETTYFERGSRHF